jgi:hypothetical protein
MLSRKLSHFNTNKKTYMLSLKLSHFNTNKKAYFKKICEALLFKHIYTKRNV